MIRRKNSPISAMSAATGLFCRYGLLYGLRYGEVVVFGALLLELALDAVPNSFAGFDGFEELRACSAMASRSRTKAAQSGCF